MLKSKYIGHGSYGCTARPAFECNNTTNENKQIVKNTITKLFSKKNVYDDEIKLHLKIAKIDKKNDFTIKLISACEIDTTFINNNIENIEKCKIIKNQDKIYQIIYEDGGIDLYDYFRRPDDNFDSYQFLKKFIFIFNGIKLLIKNSLCHSDIRLDNMLFNGEKIFLIDFGLLINFNEILTSRLGGLKYKSIYFFPDELRLYFTKTDDNFYLLNNKLNSDELLEVIDEHMYDIEYLYDEYPEYFKEIDELNGYIQEKSIFNEKQFNKNKFKKNKYETSKLFGKKLDIYQLGIVLYEIVLSIIYLYDKSQVTKIPIDIFKIIKMMLEPDVNLRIDIDTLITYYSQLFNH